MEQQDLLSNSPTFGAQQNLPNATTALVLGILSILGSFCYGVVGLICGIIGLILANRDKKLYQISPELYSASRFGTSNAGRVCCIIGIILSSLLVLVIIVVLIFFGAMITAQGFR